MPESRWYRREIVGYDLETSGPDPETARIVTATVVRFDPSSDAITQASEYLADPGVEIPAEATAVHGVSTEHAREYGRPAKVVIAAVADELVDAAQLGLPVAAFNASYDFTVLDRECRRHGLLTLADRLTAPPAAELFVLDALVIDRAVDRYRKGKRTLTAACEHYGVELTAAHTSAADALAAAKLAARLGERYPQVGELGLAELQQRQVRAHSMWAANFEGYLRRTKQRDGASDDEIAAVSIDGSWPFRAEVA